MGSASSTGMSTLMFQTGEQLPAGSIVLLLHPEEISNFTSILPRRRRGSVGPVGNYVTDRYGMTTSAGGEFHWWGRCPSGLSWRRSGGGKGERLCAWLGAGHQHQPAQKEDKRCHSTSQLHLPTAQDGSGGRGSKEGGQEERLGVAGGGQDRLGQGCSVDGQGERDSLWTSEAQVFNSIVASCFIFK